MSQQRYLLILYILGLCTVLSAEMQLESSAYAVMGKGKPIWITVNDFDYRQPLGKYWKLDVSSKMHSSDDYIGSLQDRIYYPQKTQVASHLSARYTRGFVYTEGSYWNTVYGSSRKLGLYPAWDQSFYTYERQHQHQGNLELGLNFDKLQMDAHVSGKLLVAKPYEYVWDPITFEQSVLEHDPRSYEDVYSGMQLSYMAIPQLKISALVDMKQANFDASDIYSASDIGLGAESQLKITSTGRLNGSAVWQNREGDYLPSEYRNAFTGQLRYQHKLGTAWNGYISFISNTCADSKLQDFYLISNQVRTHIKYTAGYDPNQESYVLVGAKYSPEHHANACFSEARFRIGGKFYSFAGLKIQPDLPNQIQGKLSWYYNPVSELFIDYQNVVYEHPQREKHYLGLGTKINF